MVLNSHADVLNRIASSDKALIAAEQALGLQPEFAEAHVNRGIALIALCRFSEARKSFDKALELNPSLKSVVYGNLALLHGEEGQYATSRKYAEAAASEHPDVYAYAFIRYRFSMYTPSITRQEERDLTAAVWALSPSVKKKVVRPSQHSFSVGRKIRVGYFSSDFKQHPVAEFLKPVLKRHNRDKFEIRLYDVTPDPDAFGEELRTLSDRYHCGLGQTDELLAQTIADDGIDILVDLTGLFQNSRLNVFRYRPAPVQASWIGYSGTSALDAMDYVIADKYVCPPEADVDFIEDIVRLPDHYLCHEPRDLGAMPPSLGRRQKNGITFGSFNNHMKLNTSVIRVWAEIIKRVPHSSLFLKAPRFGNADLRRHIRKQFEAWGVDPERLRLSGPLDYQGHLNAYQEVDIALDPFPYCGTTTTVDALSMGVPVVTLVGERWVQRTTYSFLSGMGWDSLCASTEQEYMEIAIGLAKNPSRLKEMKATGRSKFLASPMCNPDVFTEQLEAAYKTMWARYCESVQS